MGIGGNTVSFIHKIEIRTTYGLPAAVWRRKTPSQRQRVVGLGCLWCYVSRSVRSVSYVALLPPWGFSCSDFLVGLSLLQAKQRIIARLGNAIID